MKPMGVRWFCVVSESCLSSVRLPASSCVRYPRTRMQYVPYEYQSFSYGYRIVTTVLFNNCHSLLENEAQSVTGPFGVLLPEVPASRLLAVMGSRLLGPQ